MREKGEGNRLKIIEAADNLFYRKGYNTTSFSDIAEEAGIARGNFYYYFKTKDDILNAVIDHRIQGIEAMLESWDQEFPEPRDRLKRFVEILHKEESQILRYGCPMGSLNTELNKNHPEKHIAARMFDVFRNWLKIQLKVIGHDDDADLLAMQLMAAGQGACVLSHAYEDAEFLEREIARLNAWVDKL
jgi:AcrR family transcriptional regulator